ncbi:Ig-like domain-containing protein, partial [Vibrio sinaloensis]
MKHIRIMNKTPIIISLAIALTGCNGEGSEAIEQSNQYVIPSEAQVALTENYAAVNLEGYVESSSGAQLTDLASLSSDELCASVAINEGTLTFDTSYELGSGCVLRYSVVNSEGLANAEIAHINVSKSITGIPDFVDTIHANATASGVAIEVDVANAANFPPDFSIDASDITVDGFGDATVSQGTKIEFTPTEDSGVSVIYYTAHSEHADYEDVAVSGQIRVATSVSGTNTPPNVPITYDIGDKEIYQAQVIDMSTHISDVDAQQSLQIVDIRSDAFTHVAVNATNSLAFDVQGTLPGPAVFSYTVTDHNGGYATGEVTVNFVQRQQPGHTSDHTIYFSTPVLESEYRRVMNQTPPETLIDPSNNYHLAAYTSGSGPAEDDDLFMEAYCQAIGMRTPAESESLYIYQDSGNIAKSGNWAEASTYATLGGTDIYPIDWFSYSSGSSGSNITSRAFFCVSGTKPNTSPEVVDTSDSVEIYNPKSIPLSISDPDGDNVVIAQVITPVGVDATINGANIEVTAQTTGEHNILVVVEDDPGLQASSTVVVNAERKDVPDITPIAFFTPPVTQFEAEQNGTHVIGTKLNDLGYPMAKVTSDDAINYCRSKGMELPSVAMIRNWELANGSLNDVVAANDTMFGVWDDQANYKEYRLSDGTLENGNGETFVMCADHPRGVVYSIVPDGNMTISQTTELSVKATNKAADYEHNIDVNKGVLECSPNCVVNGAFVTPNEPGPLSVNWIGPGDIEVIDTLDVAPIDDIELSVSADENHIEWFDTSPQGSSKPRVKANGIKVLRIPVDVYNSMLYKDPYASVETIVEGIHNKKSYVYETLSLVKLTDGRWIQNGDVMELKDDTNVTAASKTPISDGYEITYHIKVQLRYLSTYYRKEIEWIRVKEGKAL